MPAVIRYHEVSKRYPHAAAPALHPTTLTVAARELLVLLGESGSGKTTLLKMANRLVEPSSGAVEVFGADVRAQDPWTLRRRIGYVIQHVGLFPHLSIADNVAVVPRLLGWSRADVAARVEELLALVGLPVASFGDRLPHQLSGGQRQRVGVARAVAARPQILLLDEPFGALDPITRRALQGELRKLHDDLGLTTLLVTHDLLEALTLADRIAVMQGGRLRQLGTPHELLTAPADDYVAALMGSARQQADEIVRLST